ncbi:FeS assembly protein SufD [Gottschalkia purinilytica]|uniref:FeS assembly protein SufD n=1 Tax=Gottschalkia purinilytica TaxID=1503 RepID=A0A0L0WAU1_GOTPU|nr:Fe-S cluster assembly protein SufD [Gottschalkia purinilytica]KNF08621.1 FeS assembly protein SufD [Gottschalkia purinilytica]
MLRELTNKELQEYKSIPNPFWKRIKEEILLPEDVLSYNKNIILDKKTDGIIDSIRNLDIRYMKYLNTNKRYGLGEKFLRLSEYFSNTGFLIDVSPNSRENKVNIDFSIDKKNPMIIDHNLIVCRENSNLDLYIKYEDDETNGFHNGFTKIYVEKGCNINIYKVQKYSKNTENFDSNVVFVEENANVNIIDIQLGSKLKGINYNVELIGDNSSCEIKSLYTGTEDDKMDFSYDIKFLGKRTNGYVESKGALSDNAWKVFRSTINFVKGCKKSRGGESEYVTLLSKNVKAHAIPALFCTEDDVIGEHAASAGQIDDNKMFYLMSRGLDKNIAKILIVESTFKPILDRLPNERMREEIVKHVRRMLGGK